MNILWQAKPPFLNARSTERTSQAWEELEATVLRRREGQDDQHAEQRQGEALVSVPGLRDWRGAGQDEVPHCGEQGKERQ